MQRSEIDRERVSSLYNTTTVSLTSYIPRLTHGDPLFTPSPFHFLLLRREMEKPATPSDEAKRLAPARSGRGAANPQVGRRVEDGHHRITFEYIVHTSFHLASAGPKPWLPYHLIPTSNTNIQY